MPEPEDLESHLGGLGTGVEYYGTHYPFVRLTPQYAGVLADFWLSHDVPTATNPLRIAQLLNFARPLDLQPQGAEGENQCDVVVVDANGAVICDTREALRYTGRQFNSRLYFHEWQLTAGVCRAIQHLKYSIDAVEAGYLRGTEEGEIRETEDGESRYTEQFNDAPPPILTVGDGELDARAYELISRRVTSITVDGLAITGPIVFQVGYNMQISQAGAPVQEVPDLLRTSLNLRPLDARVVPITRLAFSAVAGAGAGTAPGCTAAVAGLRTIERTGPDKYGNLELSAADCLFVERQKGPDNAFVPATLMLGDQCEPCLKCGDVTSTYETARGLRARLADAVTALYAVRTLYQEALSRWATAKACREDLGPMKFAATSHVSPGYPAVPPDPENEDPGQDAIPPEVSISFGVSLCNNTAVCWQNVQIRVVVASPESLEQIASFGIAADGQFTSGFSGWPTAIATWAEIKPGVTVQAQGTYRGPSNSGSGTATATFQIGGVPAPIGNPQTIVLGVST